MAGQLCTNCHAPLDISTAGPGAAVRCGYCKTENRVLGSGLAHAPSPGFRPPPASPGFGGGFGPPPASPGFGPPPASPGFGPPPASPGFGPPPASPGFGSPPAFGTPPPGGFGAPGVIGGATGLPGSYDANPKGWVAPPPATVVPSTAGSNAELIGGIAGLLAWKGVVAIIGLIIPGICCLSWIALQFFLGNSLGR